MRTELNVNSLDYTNGANDIYIQFSVCTKFITSKSILTTECFGKSANEGSCLVWAFQKSKVSGEGNR